MATVILKWNPAFSSYQMLRYLDDLYRANEYGEFDYNWSIWEHEKVHKGDKFYWVKLGYGQVGIVGSGTLSSEPYQDEDWSGKGRETFYCDLEPELLLNPDTLPILTSSELEKEITDFDWFKGHSGMVLNEKQAEKLDALWNSFVQKNTRKFQEASEKECNDQIYKKSLQ